MHVRIFTKTIIHILLSNERKQYAIIDAGKAIDMRTHSRTQVLREICFPAMLHGSIQEANPVE